MREYEKRWNWQKVKNFYMIYEISFDIFHKIQVFLSLTPNLIMFLFKSCGDDDDAGYYNNIMNSKLTFASSIFCCYYFFSSFQVGLIFLFIFLKVKIKI